MKIDTEHGIETKITKVFCPVADLFTPMLFS